MDDHQMGLAQTVSGNAFLSLYGEDMLPVRMAAMTILTTTNNGITSR